MSETEEETSEEIRAQEWEEMREYYHYNMQKRLEKKNNKVARQEKLDQNLAEIIDKLTKMALEIEELKKKIANSN